MNFLEIFIMAVGLAMDAFAVSISNGLSMKKVKLKDAGKIALFTGGCQGLFPVIGWYGGIAFSSFITEVDHWIGFILLSLIGGKMILEGFKSKENGVDSQPKPLTFYYLLTLGVATSIDALTIGVTFAFLDVFILVPALTIGVVTFIISLLGVYSGKLLGSKFKNKAEIAGGLTLIGLGLKILLEHIFF